jgi:uroporphyrinogen-III synthase
MKTVLITSSRPGADALEKAMQAQGVRTITSPLLAIEKLADSELTSLPSAENAYQAMILTSRHAINAARLFADKPVFLVGQHSRKIAERMGLRVVAHAANVQSLCELIQYQLSPAAGRLLYLSGQDVSADLSALLPEFLVDRRITYRADFLPLHQAACAALQEGRVDYVTLLSRRTAQQLLAEIAGLELARRPTALCYSQKISLFMQESSWNSCITLQEPTLSCLLETLQTIKGLDQPT